MTDMTPNKNLMPLVTGSAVALAGAVGTIASYIIHVHYGIGLPDEVEKSMLTILEALFAYSVHRLTSN